MDVVIILLLIALGVFFFKRSFSGIIYMIVILDILLRLINFLKINLVNGEVYRFLNNYFPSSIKAVIDSYTNGGLATFFTWMLVVIYIIFEFYTIRTFLRKR